ncbi:MAG: GTP-binding protein, partial [Cellulosilyticaceae bacterium]
MKLYETSQIRNIVLLGHGGSGKTTLAESMLYLSGATKRQGKVENGTTTSDFDSEEIKRKISIRTSLIPIEWKDHKLNLLDAPGYFDFIGGVKEAMSIADSALIVLRASAGVEVGTEKAWEQAEELGMPKMLFITEMDAPNVDIEAILEECKHKLGTSIAPVQIPWFENGKYVGYIHAVKRIGRRFDGDKVIECDIPEGYEAKLDHVRTMILEAVAETDEALMEKYFAEEEITVEEIETAMKKGVSEGSIVPVLCGCATEGLGVKTLLDNMVRSLPAPNERDDTCTKDEKVSLFVFRNMVDPFIGKFSFFKVKTGILRRDDVLNNQRTSELAKMVHIYVMQGKDQQEVESLCAGDIGAVSKLKDIETNDTLCEKGMDVMYDAIDFPKPYVKMAIFPLGK